jgi:putative copper export protein
MLTLAVLARVLLYVGVVAAIGTCGAEWFSREKTTLVDSGGLADLARDGERRHREAMRAWLATFVALVLMLVAQFEALELSPTRSDLAMLLRQTTWGAGWSAMAVSALCGALATGVRATLLMRVLLLMALVASMSGVGHAAADDMPMLARALDTVHVASIGVWIGTLFCMGHNAAPRAWERFSRAAVFAAPLSVVAGAGSALRRVGAADFHTIVASDYGRLLVGKTALVLIILAIGARHRSQIAKRGVATATSVRIELALAALVLLVTAVLTGTAPPGD